METLIILAVILAAFIIATYLASKSITKADTIKETLDHVAKAKEVKEYVSTLSDDVKRDKLRKYTKQ